MKSHEEPCSGEKMSEILAQLQLEEIKGAREKQYLNYKRTFGFSLTYQSSGVGNGNPLQDSCLENSMDRGAWQATVHGVPKSQTQLSPHTRMYVFMSWMGEWMDQWIGGWMGGWMDG